METASQRDIELGLKYLENRRRIMRESYYRNHEKRIEYRRERYAQQQAALGLEIRPRGRPRKTLPPTPPVENELVAVEGI